MSSLLTTAAPYGQDNNIKDNEHKAPQRKNQTYKHKDPVKKINREMVQTISNPPDSDEPKNMGAFIPVQVDMQNKVSSQGKPLEKSTDDTLVDTNTFPTLDSTFAADYYNQYNGQYNANVNANSSHTPSYNNQLPSINPNTELLKKLDNILYLLEEQRDEQTHLITEELILYLFLGIFIIYVLDSFVKVGKYVR